MQQKVQLILSEVKVKMTSKEDMKHVSDNKFILISKYQFFSCHRSTEQ